MRSYPGAGGFTSDTALATRHAPALSQDAARRVHRRREIEIEVRPCGGVEIMAARMEEMTSNSRDVPESRERPQPAAQLKIKEALKLLIDEEAAK